MANEKKLKTVVNVNFKDCPNVKKYLNLVAVANGISMKDYIINLVIEDMEKDKEPNKSFAKVCQAAEPKE